MIGRSFKVLILVCFCFFGFSCALQSNYGEIAFALPGNGNSSGKSAARGEGELPLGDALPETYTIKLTPNVGKIIEIEGKAGQNVVIPNLVPDEYEVIVEGIKNNICFHGKTNVTVEAGKIASARLALYKNEIEPIGGSSPITMADAAKLIETSKGVPVKLIISDTYDSKKLTDLVSKIKSRESFQSVYLDLSSYSNMNDVPENLFSNTLSLKSVVLPSSVQTIGANAFKSCSNLTSINLANVTNLGSEAFDGCKNLTSVDLSNVTEIPIRCFRNCYALSTVNVSNNLNSILDGAFYNCGALTSFTIPKNVTCIDINAFAIFSSDIGSGLKSVIFEDVNSKWTLRSRWGGAETYLVTNGDLAKQADKLKIAQTTWTKEIKNPVAP